jgi:hypothetical protein
LCGIERKEGGVSGNAMRGDGFGAWEPTSVMYGDFTQETWSTRRNVVQLTEVAGFSSVRILTCPATLHGAKKAVRVVRWKPLSALSELALAVETGKLPGRIVTRNPASVAVTI